MKKYYLLAAMALVMCACGNKNSEKVSDNVAESATSEWTKIEPKEFEKNPFKLFQDDWMLLTAGQDSTINMMTIAWGGMGILWNKPVVTVYVSTSRYTYKYMEANEYFTVTSFPEQYREKLQYMGSVSGRDTDKLKGSGLTAERTELGNTIYGEADFAIECKKIYAEQLDKSLIPIEQREWYDNTNTGVHVMYIGEIVNAWKK